MSGHESGGTGGQVIALAPRNRQRQARGHESGLSRVHLAGGRDVSDMLAAAMSEADLQECVRQTCVALRLPYFHVHDSRRSPEGWPDVAVVVGNHLVLRELKTMRGAPTPAQLRWLDALSRVTRVSAGIWRPDAWRSGEIERVLRGEM